MRVFPALIAAALLYGSAGAQPPHRVQVCLTEVSSGEEHRYRIPSKRKKPQRLLLHAEPAQETLVVVAGFEGEDVSSQYAPATYVLNRHQNWVEPLPVARTETRLFVVFLPPQSADAQQVKKLIANYQRSGDPGGPVAGKLYEQLTRWSGEGGNGLARGGEQRTGTGGVRITSALVANPEANTRGSKSKADAPRAPGPGTRETTGYSAGEPYDWHKDAELIYYTPQVHGTVVYTLKP